MSATSKDTTVRETIPQNQCISVGIKGGTRLILSSNIKLAADDLVVEIALREHILL